MLTREELKNAKNNVMTIMENRIMQMTSCDRATANLVAIDQAVAHGIIHKNAAARKKSRFTKKLNALG